MHYPFTFENSSGFNGFVLQKWWGHFVELALVLMEISNQLAIKFCCLTALNVSKKMALMDMTTF